MALGFNNVPIDWTQMDASQVTWGRSLAQGMDAIGQGIREYQDRARKKQVDEAAVGMLKQYGAQFGLPEEILRDEKALKAGIDALGAENFLQLGMAGGQLAQRRKAAEAEALAMRQEQTAQGEGLARYDAAIKSGATPDAATLEAIKGYQERGGFNMAEFLGTFEKAGRMSLDVRKAERDEASAPIDADYKRALTDKARTETEQMKKEEADSPLGEAKPINGLSGWTQVRTGKNSIQVIPPQGMDDRQRLAALAQAIPQKEFDAYMKSHRGEKGYNDDGPGWGRNPINPLMEAYAAALGQPAYTRNDKGEVVLMAAPATAQPPPLTGAPVPPPAPTVTGYPGLPPEMQGVFPQ